MVTMRDVRRTIPGRVYLETLPFDLPERGRMVGNVNCPWHDDRHASLTVNLEKMVFYCHACCQGGKILESSVKPLSPGKPAFQSRPLAVPGKRQTWTEVPVFGGEVPQAPDFTYREMWRDRGCLLLKHECGLWSRLKRECGRAVKGFRLVCWQWSCPECFVRLRDWWLQRFMSESRPVEAFVFIQDNWSIQGVLKKLAYLAKKAGSKLEYALIASPYGRYLFLRGIRQVFEADPLTFEDIFPPNVEINYGPSEQQLKYAYWNALDHDGKPVEHRRKIRLSRNFLSDENEKKAKRKENKEIARAVAEIKEEIYTNAGEEAPMRGSKKGHWETYLCKLEDLVKKEEAKGAYVHWVSNDYVEFIWPEESEKPEPVPGGKRWEDMQPHLVADEVWQ